MNTQEKNKLIADFMGARSTTFQDGTTGHTFWNEEGVEGRGGKFPNGNTNYWNYREGYNTSWDWLMPVVEKIKSLGHYPEQTKWIDYFLADVNNIEAHRAVVEFIQWYNENKED